MKKLAVRVENLKFGMFVAELDRPWEGTPFAFQGFVLTTQKQLEALRKYCKTVYVDPEKEEIDLRLPPLAAATRQPERPSADGGIRGGTAYPDSASVEQELPRADTVRAQTERTLADTFRAAHVGEPLDGKRLREAVTRITESVVRNPDAMLLIHRMREKGEKLLQRATGVSIYMVVFGRFLQLPREALELLGLLGMLQDIGKTRVPDALLAKRGRLTPEELAVARAHVEHSMTILSTTHGLPAELPTLAGLHHERYDGSGYPRGIAGSEIGLYGSIAGLVDCFDALTMERPYAEQFSPSNALGMLYKLRDLRFQGALVEQFIQCIGIYPVGSVVEMNTGEIGVVVSQNLVRRLQPRVLLVMDASGKPIRPHKLLDLLKEPSATAEEPYRIRRTLEHGKVAIDPKELFL